jgi:hypothetical protein
MFQKIAATFRAHPALRLFAVAALAVVALVLVVKYVVKKPALPADTTSGGFDVPSGTDQSATGTLVPLAPVTIINNIPPTTTGGGINPPPPPPPPARRPINPDPFPANGRTLPQIGAIVGKSADSLYRDPRNAKVRSYILSKNPKGGDGNNYVPIPSGYSLYW